MQEDGQYVADGGPVLIACGQGKSMYDVKGCLSSWVLRGGGGGGQKDRVKEKLAAAGGGGQGGVLATTAVCAGDAHSSLRC